MVEPVDPFEGRIFDSLEAAPRATPKDYARRNQSCSRSTPPLPSATHGPARDLAPSAPHARRLPAHTCSLPCLSALHLLRSWSLRQTRRGSLRQTFGSVERWDYVSDGGTFPAGTSVAQFAYFKWDNGVGWATLHIGSGGERTHISHDFTGAGAELPQASSRPTMEAMARASAVLQTACRLNLSGMQWREIGQNVEALD